MRPSSAAAAMPLRQRKAAVPEIERLLRRDPEGIQVLDHVTDAGEKDSGRGGSPSGAGGAGVRARANPTTSV